MNKDVTFFEKVDPNSVAKAPSEKPIYLKDYHRMNLLGEVTNDADEKPFAIQQREDKERLVAEIHGALDGNAGNDYGDDNDSEDDFLTKRKDEREVATLDLPDPTANEGGNFLQAFFDNKAWLPKSIDKETGKPIVPSYGEIVEDDEEFEDDADRFETAYNFRFEDPNAAEIVSYARNQNTLRRSEETRRKRQRDAKNSVKKEKELKREAEISKIKTKKVKEVVSKFEQLRQALGNDAESEALSKILSEQDLDGDFEGDEWDKKMQAVFNEEFYAQEVRKPKWDKDSDNEGEDEGEGEDEEQDDDAVMEDAAEPTVSKNQQKRAEKRKKKQEHQEIRDKAQRLVEENIDLLLEKEGASHLLNDGTGTDDTPKFRYREVSPEAFGLSARDILLANDNDLNEYVGLKKLAPFREPEKKKKDHRKYAKKRRLREWRKGVFNNEEEPDDATVVEALTGGGVGNLSKGDARSNKKQKKSHKKQKRN